MAWTTMHFAMGMGCAGVLATGVCLCLRRGWRWLPAAMTVGGVWGLVPDLPRIWREDFPNLPLASVLGSRQLEQTLHQWGDLFFFHRMLDSQPHEYALHGLVVILVLYNASIAGLMLMERRQRRSARRLARHAEALNLRSRPAMPRRVHPSHLARSA